MRRAAAAAMSALLLAACSSGGTPTTRSTAPGTSNPPGRAPSTTTSPPAATRGPADWPTYHGGADRAGFAASSLQLPLHRSWTRRLDGALYAEPIVADGRVIAATENDSVYAFSPSGRQLWRARLGTPVSLSALPCGNIDPLGITGTPAYDATTRSVFVVTETTGAHHTLVALDVTSGKVRWTRDVDAFPDRDRRAQQQRSALLVAGDRVIVAFGGLYGDCGDYVGYLVSVRTDGGGPGFRYGVPTRREAGMWAPPGPVVGPGGQVYVAVGNGAATGGSWDGSDSVLRFTPTLHRTAWFAPRGWPADNAADLDLGSSSPVVVGDRLVMAGKRGTVYLLAARLGGIGGEVESVDGCRAFGGGARKGDVVVLPCTDGIRAIRVGNRTMTWMWSRPGLAGSPTIAGDTVLSLDRDSGDLDLLSLSTGRAQGSVHVGDVTRFATPTPYGDQVFVGTANALVALSGRS